MTLSPPFRLLSRALAAASLIVTGLVLPGTVPTAAAATCGTSNIAQGKTATASSTENGSYPAANAVDGNTGTRWSSAFTDPQWLQVDLGSTQTICQVTLNWEAAYGKAFQIQTSTGQRHLDHHLHHHHRHRRHPDPHRHRHRPVRPHVRHRPRHRVRLLPLGIGRVFGSGMHRRRHRLHGPTSNPPELRPERLRLRPGHVQPTIQSRARHRLQPAEDQPVRHRAVRAAVQAGHLHRGRQPRLLHQVAGLGCSPDDVNINGHVRSRRSTGTAATRRRTSGGRPRTWPSTLPAGTMSAGPSPRPRRTDGCTCAATRQLWNGGDGWSSGGFIADYQDRRPGRLRFAAAVVLPTASSAAGAARCGTWSSPGCTALRRSTSRTRRTPRRHDAGQRGRSRSSTSTAR